VLQKKAVHRNNIFKSRGCRLPVCGNTRGIASDPSAPTAVAARNGTGCYVCGQLAIASEGQPGNHRFVAGGGRSISGEQTQRPSDQDDFKNWVPTLLFGDMAAAIAEREGDAFSKGKYWLSLCAGQQSDRSAAQRSGYRYVPIDNRQQVEAFSVTSTNHVVDLETGNIFEEIKTILGGEEALLDIAVIMLFTPCETDSSLSVKRHRGADGAATSDRAAAVDRISANIEKFLQDLDTLRGRAAAEGCSCARRGRQN
jgi:hypothetical protein